MAAIALRLTQRACAVDALFLEAALLSVRRAAGYDDFAVGCWVTNDTSIARLNKSYRGKRGPTDVLSFANLSLAAPEGIEGRLLGGRPTATRAAAASDVAALDEATRADVLRLQQPGSRGRGQRLQTQGQEPLDAHADPAALELAAERDLGDIVISAPYVARYCASNNLLVPRHYCMLLTHGLVHLLGYDHESDAQHAQMSDREGPLLAHLLRQIEQGVLPEWQPGRGKAGAK